MNKRKVCQVGAADVFICSPDLPRPPHDFQSRYFIILHFQTHCTPYLLKPNSKLRRLFAMKQFTTPDLPESDSKARRLLAMKQFTTGFVEISYPPPLNDFPFEHPNSLQLWACAGALVAPVAIWPY